MRKLAAAAGMGESCVEASRESPSLREAAVSSPSNLLSVQCPKMSTEPSESVASTAGGGTSSILCTAVVSTFTHGASALFKDKVGGSTPEKRSVFRASIQKTTAATCTMLKESLVHLLTTKSGLVFVSLAKAAF